MILHVDPLRFAHRFLRAVRRRFKVTVSLSVRTGFDPATRTILWRPRDGFETLLHEAAHVALRHRRGDGPGPALGQELDAWLWAEQAAHLWGLPFNYKRANRFFTTYTRLVRGAEGWTIQWQHRAPLRRSSTPA